MNKKMVVISAVLIVVLLVLITHSQRKTDTKNSPPIANAGEDFIINAGDVAVFNGSGIDKDGYIVKYEWDFDGGGKYDWMSKKTGKAKFRYEKNGIYEARFRVTDNHCATATDTVKVRVNAVPEIIDYEPEESIVSCYEGDAIQFYITPYDSDEDELNITWYLNGEKVSDNMKWVWNTPYQSKGVYDVIVQVSDGFAYCDITWEVKVKDKNHPVEVISYIPSSSDVVCEEKEAVRFGVVAEDVDGDEIYFKWSLDGEYISDGPGFIYVPDYDSSGDHVVVVEISDGENTKTHIWNVKVMNKNQPPIIKSYRPEEDVIEIKENMQIEFSATAYDPDGDEIYITWYLDDKEMGYDCVININFGYDDNGTHVVKVEISDSIDSINHSWIVNVVNTNRPPYISSYSPEQKTLVIYERESINFRVEADDPDNDIIFLTWYVEDVRVATGSEFNFTTDFSGSERSPYKVRVDVSDEKFTISLSWDVTVLNYNRAPYIERMSPEDRNITIREGESITFRVTANDPDGDEIYYIWYLNDTEVGRASYYKYTASSWSGKYSPYTIKVVVMDNNSNPKRCIISWNLTVIPINEPPVADAGPDRVYHDNMVTLDGSKSYDPDRDSLNYTWDFGDGSPMGFGKIVNHQYPLYDATYIVTLTVSDGFYMSSDTCIITIDIDDGAPGKPVVYFYTKKPIFDTVTVSIKDGRVTTTIPEVPMDESATWENVYLKDGKVIYNGKVYPYLFYEGTGKSLMTSGGWILARDENGRITLNGEDMSINDLHKFFYNELIKAGMYPWEAKDFADFWFGDDKKIFFGRDVFAYAIKYIPQEVLNDDIPIRTSHNYDTVVRVMFLVKPALSEEKLNPPAYPLVINRGDVMHEWGIIIDRNIVDSDKYTEWLKNHTNEKNDDKIKIKKISSSAHPLFVFSFIDILPTILLVIVVAPHLIRKIRKK